MGYAGGAAAAAAAAVANATKASGAIVKLSGSEFQRILDRMEEGIVVTTESSFFGKTYKYLTNYKGLFFYTRSKSPLRFSSKIEVVNAGSIWVPN